MLTCAVLFSNGDIHNMATPEVPTTTIHIEENITSYNVEETLQSGDPVSSGIPVNMHISEVATNDVHLEDDISSIKAKEMLPSITNVSDGVPSHSASIENSSGASPNHINGSTCGKCG